jgi:hypothetical protein
VAASVAAMLGTRTRVVRARVIVSSGAFAWGDGHEPARELVGWVSGARSVGGDGDGGGAGKGTGWRGINTVDAVVGSSGVRRWAGKAALTWTNPRVG